jgi:uncharacterized protein YcbX
MSIIGTVESLWRYPVKSMRGEELDEVFAGEFGIYGDRLFGFKSSASPKDFPYVTGRQQSEMLRYRPRLCYPAKVASPIDTVLVTPAELMVEVETPDGQALAIDDPGLIVRLCAGLDPKHEVTLLRADRAMTDCHPLSLFAVQTVKQLAQETGHALDKRRFRANVYLDLASSEGFAEDRFVGRRLRIGPKVIVSVVARDGRCMMITLDPDTANKTPEILKKVAQAHEGMAGVYGRVLVEGILRKGDVIELLD